MQTRSNPTNLRNRHLLAIDALLLSGAPMFAYALRFEGFNWAPADLHAALVYTAISIPLKLAVFLGLGLYQQLWQHAGIVEMKQIVLGGLAAAAACSFLGILLLPGTGATEFRVPVSVVFLDSFMTFGIVAGSRMLTKVLGSRQQRRPKGKTKRALIVGAGQAGAMITKEMLANPELLGLVPVGFVDDDPHKRRHRLFDLPVFGTLAQISEIVVREHIEIIVIAMPTAPGQVVRSVVRVAEEAGISARTVPGLYEILSGRVGISNLRKVEIQDLLRRTPVRTDLDTVRSIVEAQTVLVTGAGGSIGRELCRQIAELGPGHLIALGHGENSIFETLQELNERFPALSVRPVIIDVRGRDRMRSLFARLQPDVVFHAAAHKHVHLMEANVAEAIENNVLGTFSVVEAALAAGTGRFVLISTDKAVRPTGVMGATKRVAELVVQQVARNASLPYVAVRFGNVLGSRGSVVPTFMRQIQQGGPLTVTHPNMRRYFMTIPEAVQLVMQAAALGRGGEVFLLDMGEQVRIVDLAQDLIRLSGLQAGTDIEIQYTGVRPGERLCEEMFFAEESAVPTVHPRILRGRSASSQVSPMELIDRLIAAAQSERPEAELVTMLRAIIPDFAPERSASREGAHITAAPLPTEVVQQVAAAAGVSLTKRAEWPVDGKRGLLDKAAAT